MSDDYTGRVFVYDYEGHRDGVVVEPRCITCRRFVSGENTRVVYLGDEGVDRFEGWTCPRCGPFQPDVLCWAGDLT